MMIFEGVRVDLLHDPRPQNQAQVHRVRAGAPPGVRLRPHRRLQRSHHGQADTGQVLWVQAPPSSDRQREHDVAGLQIRRLCAEEGKTLSEKFH